MINRRQPFARCLAALRAAVVLAAAACAGDPASRQETHTPDFRNPAFSVSPVALLTIGPNPGDPAHELPGIGSAALTESGRILVIPHRMSEIWLFDRDGRYLRAYGRTGDGPGEFRRPTAVFALQGEELLVYDDGARRTTRLDSSGKVVRTWDDVQKVVCCFSDGAFLFEPDAPRAFSFVDPDPRDTTSIATAFALVAPADPVTDRSPLLTLPRTRDGITVLQPGFSGRNTYPRPFARVTSVAIAGDEIIYGTGASFSYSVFSRSGAPTRSVSVPYEQKKISQELLAQLREMFVADADAAEMKTKHRQIFDATPHHNTEPAYREILAEEDGTVWVRRYESEFRGSHWWVGFDREGKLTGTLRTPDSLTVERITRGHVILSRANDSTGVSTLLVHAIVKN